MDERARGLFNALKQGLEAEGYKLSNLSLPFLKKTLEDHVANMEQWRKDLQQMSQEDIQTHLEELQRQYNELDSKA